MAKKRLGEVLKQAREEKEKTLREVEKATGVHNAHISQLENHVITKPEPAMLFPLAEYYQLDYFELLELAGWGEGESSGRERKRVSVAMRTMGDLTPGEQNQVLDFIAELKSNKNDD